MNVILGMMATKEEKLTQERETGFLRAILARFLAVIATLAVTGACLFIAAGTLRWARGWWYLGLCFFGLIVNGIVLLRKNPAVIVERGKRHRGTKPFDKVFAVLYGPVILALPVIAGLDAVRYSWAPLSFSFFYAGTALHLAGQVPLLLSMAENPHLETTVRIQDDRGHAVITSGPYRIIRHPFYIGIILQNAALPLFLGSLWAFAPAAAAAILLVVRTALEDRTLQRELPGYAEYARRTRYRLIPGIW